ncbi:MAG: PIN domain-containing protein [Candidatus Aenigmarchaeota archaeon]|nr:PIN domain-containing protein [Candidatus Aenigmarchaeota archaeon]
MMLDTYAWIEHFKGNEKGKVVDGFIINEDCYTSILSLAEIAEWCLKNRLEAEYYINVVKKLSKILDLDEGIALFGAKLSFEHKKIIRDWGIIDSIIYATARIYNQKILTGDKHFETLEEVVLL